MRAMTTIAFALFAAAGCAIAQETVVGVTTTGNVVRFSPSAPGTFLSNQPITGLNQGDRIQGIDFRPQTGEIIALGETTQLYSLNAMTGVATPIGTGFTPALDGGAFTRHAIDINPTVDRVRVVGSGAQNRRLNPITGGSAALDTNLSYNPPVGLGLPPRAVAVAYTNSVFGAPVGSTREYILDSLNNVLAEVGTQAGGNPSFNGGVIASSFAVQLGSSTIDFGDNAGLDISSATGIAYASLDLQTDPANSPSGFYTINLANGQATFLGSAGVSLRDITVIPAPASAAMLAAGALAALRRRRK
jgi:uncharacterized protein (TIGR03382 family)